MESGVTRFRYSLYNCCQSLLIHSYNTYKYTYQSQCDLASQLELCSLDCALPASLHFTKRTQLNLLHRPSPHFDQLTLIDVCETFFYFVYNYIYVCITDATCPWTVSKRLKKFKCNKSNDSCKSVRRKFIRCRRTVHCYVETMRVQLS